MVSLETQANSLNYKAIAFLLRFIDYWHLDCLYIELNSNKGERWLAGMKKRFTKEMAKWKNVDVNIALIRIWSNV